jgi:putative peptidoglycan lipid II flippase
MAVGILALCLGFARELFIVRQYGLGKETDAYFIAAFTPQIIYQLIIAGPVLAALVPEFNRIAALNGTESMDSVAAALLGRAAAWSTVVVAAFIIGAPLIARISAPGYGPERLGLTSQLLAILGPQILSYGTGSVLTAVLYARGRILLAVLAQVVNNALILLLIAVLYRPLGIQGIALGVTLASIGYVGWLFGAVGLTGTVIIPRLRGLRNHRHIVVASLIPLFGISLLGQFSGFWERLFASTLPVGQVSGISYGYRILFLAQAATAAVGTVALASLSGSLARRETTLFRSQTGWALEVSLILATTAAAVLIASAEVVVHALYGTRSMSHVSPNMVANVVRIAAFSLPALSLQVAFTQVLYARRHLGALAVMAAMLVAIQLPLSPLLILNYGYRGFALANVAAQIAVATGYYVYLLRIELVPNPAWMLRAIVRPAFAAAVGAGTVAWLWPALDASASSLSASLDLCIRALVSVSLVCVLLVALGDPLMRLPFQMLVGRVMGPKPT